MSDDRAGVLARFVEEIDPADAAALAAALREATEGPGAAGRRGIGAGRDRRRRPHRLRRRRGDSPGRRGSAGRRGRCGRHGWGPRRWWRRRGPCRSRWCSAGVTVFLPASGLTVDVGHLIGACLGRLRAAYGTPAGAGIATAGQVLTVGMLLRGAWTGSRSSGGGAPSAGGTGCCCGGRARDRAGRARGRARAGRGGRLRGRRVGSGRSSSRGGSSTCSAARSCRRCSPTSTRTSPRATTGGSPPPRSSRRRCRWSRCCVTPQPAWAGCSRWRPTSSPRPTTSRG